MANKLYSKIANGTTLKRSRKRQNPIESSELNETIEGNLNFFECSRRPSVKASSLHGVKQLLPKDHRIRNNEAICSNNKWEFEIGVTPGERTVTESCTMKIPVSSVRRKNGIFTCGTDIADPLTGFEQLCEMYGARSYLLDNLNNFGYRRPTPVQMQSIPVIMAKRELLACAPTGSGKTLAFILPILITLKSIQNRGFRAVVLSPTRELAKQIHREFNRMALGSGLKIHCLKKCNATSNNFGLQSSKRFDILITTPNRLIQCLSRTKCPEGAVVDLSNVELLILDEADKLFENSRNSFKEQIAIICKCCDNPKVRRVLFTATLSYELENWCKLYLDNHLRVIVGRRNAAAETVDQELKFVGQEDGKLLALRNLIRKNFYPPVLVFVQDKDRAKQLFQELIYDGVNVEVIHSDRTQVQRDNVVKNFRSGKIWILIATELMSRGIDFKGVNLVINYDFPMSATAYIHRIGRAGRAGRKGKAITFFTRKDLSHLQSVTNVMEASNCDVPKWITQKTTFRRQRKKNVTKTSIKREPIRTVAVYDLRKTSRKRKIIEASKQRTKKQREI